MASPKQRRRSQSHQVGGLMADFEAAATVNYLRWPTRVVARPLDKELRRKAEQVFKSYLLYRTPEAWAAGDYLRLARLATDTARLDREMTKLAEDDGGNSAWAKQLQASVAMLSRQLGLNASPIDPRVHATAAEARRKASAVLGHGDEDGLLAGVKTGVPPSSKGRPN